MARSMGCHCCGEWGHSQSQCEWKDEYKEWFRRTRGARTHNVEEEVDAVENTNPGSEEGESGEPFVRSRSGSSLL